MSIPSKRIVSVKLPRLHKLQQEIKACAAKRRIVLAGRQFGKTTLFADLAIETMMPGGIVYEYAPIAKQTNIFWRATKRAMRPLIDANIAKKWEAPDRIIELPNGGYLQAQTAHDVDHMRGGNCDLLLFDEYAYMQGECWTVAGAPMLLARNGKAVFAFTPNRHNHAFDLYQQAITDTSGLFATFHATSYDNPHLNREALESMKADMTDEMIEQEIMAVFLESQGSVFRNIAACTTLETDNPGHHEHHRIVIGCDWGKQSDFSAFSVGCADCMVEVDRDRSNQVDYHVQRQRLGTLARRWKATAILAESNAMGAPIIEELQRDGLPVISFETTAITKPPLIENLALALERAEWKFLNDPVWRAELEAYERIVSPVTGRSSYSAPAGLHDDTVIARALMLFAANAAQAHRPDEIIYAPVQIGPQW